MFCRDRNISLSPHQHPAPSRSYQPKAWERHSLELRTEEENDVPVAKFPDSLCHAYKDHCQTNIYSSTFSFSNFIKHLCDFVIF